MSYLCFMEAKKLHGGTRKGAGRKKLANRKDLVNLYVSNLAILKFGGKEKLKDELYAFIENYKVEKPAVNMAPVSRHYPVKLEDMSMDQIRDEIRKTDTLEDLEILMRKIKATPLTFVAKRTLEMFAKDYSKSLYTD